MMMTDDPSKLLGRVASLHLHSEEPGHPMVPVLSLELIAGEGIAGNKRYLRRATRRQVTLMERELLGEHAAVLGLDGIEPGRVRANIETTGICLREWIGRRIQIGTAVLYVYEARIPCHKMDAIAVGLRRLMENGRQGVLAQVTRSGVIQAGDTITLANLNGVS